ILKNNLRRLHINDCTKATQIPQCYRNCATLRIRGLPDGSGREVVASWATCELDLSGMHIEGPHDIRCAVGVQHALGCDIQGLSGVQIHNPARLPPLDESSKESRTIVEQHFARTDRQRKCSVGSQVVYTRVRKQCVIAVSVGWIGKCSAETTTNQAVNAEV